MLDKAMHLFREHGFAGTSADMLVQATGITRHSLYLEFGSKQGLFDAALQRYDDLVVSRNFAPLEATGAGLDEIRSLFVFFGSATDGPAAGRGCLLTNTAVELGPVDPTGRGFVDRYLKRIEGALANALAGARSRGRLRDEVDIDMEARFFASAVLGLFVLLRASAPANVVLDAARGALAHLESLGA